jgi:xanthine dehydrogenase molybdopterin-binding subunit B
MMPFTAAVPGAHRALNDQLCHCTDDVAHDITTGSSSSETQVHFYIEPQTAFAIPDEDGKMKVGSALQWVRPF